MFFNRRRKKYQFLIDDFGMSLVFDKKSKYFDNYQIQLRSGDFILNYIMDRSFLNIYIESEYEDGYSLPLSFIRDYIYNPDHIGFFNFPDNASNVNHLNDFIRKDFNKIVDLYSRDKYKITYNMIEQLLAEQRKN
ncbi:MAG: hypothetical protein RIS29_2841 [Bacteroidota bacterium]